MGQHYIKASWIGSYFSSDIKTKRSRKRLVNFISINNLYENEIDDLDFVFQSSLKKNCQKNI